MKKVSHKVGFIVLAAAISVAILVSGGFLYYQHQQLSAQVTKSALATLQQYSDKVSKYQLGNKAELTKSIEQARTMVKNGNPEGAIASMANFGPKVNFSIRQFVEAKRLQDKIAKDKADAEAKAKADADAAAKAKADADAAAVAKSKPSQTTNTSASTQSYPVSTGSCGKNEYYVVVNVNSNHEDIYMGDPDCRTGNVVESHSVATGMHENLWNPAGWWYWGATPIGKWRIISKESEPYSSQFGPWFLRLHYLAGGYVDSYALHGTDTPSSIGNWASHGCIRHDNSVIEHLKDILPVGTTVWTVG